MSWCFCGRQRYARREQRNAVKREFNCLGQVQWLATLHAAEPRTSAHQTETLDRRVWSHAAPAKPVAVPAGANNAVQAALTAAMALTVQLAGPGAAAATGGTRDPLAITLPLAAGADGGTSISASLPLPSAPLHDTSALLL